MEDTTTPGTHPDVRAAVDEFNSLEHDLAEEEKRDAAHHASTNNVDVEKGTGAGPEFNIREFFEESARQEASKGHKPKRMGLVVKDLTVVGLGADAMTIPDNWSPIKSLWPLNWFKKPQGTLFDILHEVSAFCKDGEMLLVLGRPGSGCSTFLRVAANERSIYVDVKGDVSYGGIPASEFGPYKGEALYIPEEDTHFPTITLKETLTFALRTKTPGNRFSGETRRRFRQKIYDSLVRMFGLVNQGYTMVGNEFVRGLSGGERKRTTITEAMVSRSAINCWDCSTRGLDAASALDYATSLRIITETLHKTTIASFYQASESIYNLFDRVLVLDRGRPIYFGPTNEAKQYFIDLGFECEPRKTTPDFLTGISNPQERRVRKGFEDTVPGNSVELEQAFLNSEQHARSLRELAEYEQTIREESPHVDFKEAVRHSKAKRAGKNSVYTSSVWEQLHALVVRQALIFLGDRFGLFSRYFSALVLGFLYSSMFYNMPLTSQGGFLRGAALFSSIFFNCFIAQSEMIGVFFGRRIIQKQKSYAMYHPGLHHIAQVILDIPVLISQSLVFGTISYWMYGLDADAGKFITHICILTLHALCVTAIVRLLGNVSPSLYLTQQLMGLCFVLMFIYMGFTIPHDQMHPWLSWIYWINPFTYAFKAFYTTEMKGLVFKCDVDGHFPYGTSYTDPAYRVCALPGSTPGSTELAGETYLLNVYDFKVSERSLDIVVVMLFWLFFTAINYWLVETIDRVSGGFMMKVYKGGNAPERSVEKELETAKIAAEAADNMPPIEMRAGIFLWKDIKYTVPVHDGYRVLLEGVSGWIKPGQMTALMGSSGAGKTTLLDVLAQRKTQGKVEGTMLLNGRPLRKDFERITGYVEQTDVHNPLLTVREALRYSAKLRQEAHVPIAEKYEYVERVLEMMEMKDLGDALIGDLDAGVGISVEERKRLTIGMELVAKPHILFLDEPTSGLDAQSAYNIVKFIRKLADAGMPLVCTIHQPSAALFEFFDRLLLVARGGKVVYFGDMGENSSTLLGYFERNGARPCGESENPAEYILEAIGAGVGGKTDKDWVTIWRQSPEAAAMLPELSASMDSKASDGGSGNAKEFATSTFYQIYQLMLRFNVIYWRNPNYNFGRILQAFLVGLAVGFSFWQVSGSTSDIQLIQLAIFMALILGVMMMFGAIPQFLYMREHFKRDYASKYYSSLPFALTMNLVELPYLILVASLCILCFYWSVGLNIGSSLDGFYFWLIFIVFVFFCHSLGVFVAAMSPHAGAAMVLLSVLMGFLFLMAGVFIPPMSMPHFWHAWAYQVDPFRYFTEGIMSTALDPLIVRCSNRDFFRFSPPPGLTCGNYTAEFLTYATGYINNPQAMAPELCEYCQFNSGREYLSSVLDWDVDHRWRNFGLLVGYWMFNVFLGVIFVYIFRKQKR